MATYNRSNFGLTTLTAAIETTDGTSIAVASGTTFPAAPFLVTIDTEILKCTDKGAGTNWTVTRGEQSSTAATHLIGTVVSHNITAGDFTNLVEGPASAVDAHLAVFDSTTGKLIKDGGACTAAGLALLDDATAADQRTTLGAAATSHSHAESDVTNLITDLAAKLSLAGGTLTGPLGIGVAPTGRLDIQGVAANDLPTYSAEFLGSGGWTSTDWTGSFAAGWEHPVGTIESISLGSGGSGYTATDVITVVQAGGSLGTVTVNTVDGSGAILTCTRLAKGSGYAVANGLAVTGGTGSSATINILTINNTTALSQSTAAASGTKYQITYTVTNRTAGTFTIAFGGQTNTNLSATGAWGPTASSTASLVVTPTATFDGKIVLSIKSITEISVPLFNLRTSDGTIRLEMRGTANNGNTFLGIGAGRYNTTGSNNTFNGYASGAANTTGTNNTFNGYYSGYANTTGSYNVFNGYASGTANTTGSNNTFNGYASGAANTTGSYNVFNGGFSGRYIADGSANTISNNSVCLGHDTRLKFNGDSNEMVLGYLAIGNGSNTATIGNSNVTDVYMATAATMHAGKLALFTLNTAPSSATAAGTTGEIRWASGYVYLCVATNTWQRAALATW